MKGKKRLFGKLVAITLVITLVMSIFSLGATVASANGVKSLYVIASINNSPTPIEAWSIQPSPTYVTYQASASVPYFAGGAVGLGLDTASETLFISYEFTNVIQLIDATTFADLGTTTAPGASDLAGIVMDQDNSLLYTIDRWTNSLYVYTFNPVTKVLTQVGPPVSLAGTSGAFGLALDEVNDWLFVADFTGGVVNYYNTFDWSLAGTFAPSHSPISVAVEWATGLVYTGGAWGGSPLLSQYHLGTSTEATVSTVGIIGTAVDQATGLIYCTTGFSADDLRVYDSSLTQLHQTVLNFQGDPTGIVIPTEAVSYNPLNLSKDDGLGGGTISPGENITYTISFDNVDNPLDATGVVLVDTLPPEVSFVEASDGGIYDGGTGKVTWNIGTLLAGASTQSVTLKVTVNPGTPDATVITNNCEIDSNETGPAFASEDTTVSTNGGPGPGPQVPSMTTWGIIAAAILMVIMIPLALRRRLPTIL
jgi:uncharacterized repeat protein (TIGR01451 family)